jgi:DNA polymerase-4
MHAEIHRLADKACSRLRARQLIGGCVTVKIRRGDFTTYTRQRAIEPRTQETRVIQRVAADLLDAWRKTQPHAALRLLGVGVTDLAETVQADLFAASESTRNRQLDAAVDAVREKFGNVALRSASTLDKPKRG